MSTPQTAGPVRSTLVDITKCIGCRACQVACKQWNDKDGEITSFDEDLGRGLAAIHRSGAPGFGLDHDNFIGRLPQSNRRAASWSAFYRDQRLEPQVRMAADAGLMPPALRRSFTRLFTVLPERVGPPEPPARLHGDLWSGNVMAD